MTDQPRDPATEVHRVASPDSTRVASYLAGRDEVSRVLLLYSGGLDTSVMLKWIQDEYEAEVVALTVNLGQPGEDYEVVKDKALRLGALDCHVVDAREEFARGVRPAGDQGQRRLRRRLPALHRARPPADREARRRVRAQERLRHDRPRLHGQGQRPGPDRGHGRDARARAEGDRAGALVGDGPRRGDRVRAQARHPGQGRDRGRAVLDRRQPLGPLVRGQVDRGPHARARRRRLPARHAPRARARRGGGRDGRVRAGRPGRAQRRAARPGRPDRARRPRSACATASGSSTTSRTASSASRCATSTRCRPPRSCSRRTRSSSASTGTIHQNQFKPRLDQQWAYLVYAGLWWEPLREDIEAYVEHVNRRVTGTIGIKLFKGGARVVTRESPNAVYDAQLATFAESGGLFSQQASPGFIEIWSLQSRMARRIRGEE